MAHSPLKSLGFFGLPPAIRHVRMAPCPYGVAHGRRLCQSPGQPMADEGRFPDISNSKGAPRMGLRAFFIVAAVLVSSSQIVEAAEQSVLRRVSCSVVRFYVAKYSAGAAEAYARSKGASEAEIEFGSPLPEGFAGHYRAELAELAELNAAAGSEQHVRPPSGGLFCRRVGARNVHRHAAPRLSSAPLSVWRQNRKKPWQIFSDLILKADIAPPTAARRSQCL